MNNYAENLLSQVKSYKNKLYKNMLMKGCILTAAAILAAFTTVNVLEYFGNFNSIVRAVFFYGFLSLAVLLSLRWIFFPLFKLLSAKRQISDLDAAAQIGSFFPQVKDKLTNILQLKNAAVEGSLALAGINKKASQISHLEFTEAIQYKENRKYLKYLIPIFFFTAGLYLILPQIFTESTERIVHYSDTFEPQAPFSFEINNQNLTTFKNEDFPISVKLKGNVVPSEVFLHTESGRRIKMEKIAADEFTFEFKKIQEKFNFSFEGMGFRSKTYAVKVLERPQLNNFTVFLEYPSYIGKSSERFDNNGNLVVPEGTKITWNIHTRQANEFSAFFTADSTSFPADEISQDVFQFSKNIRRNTACRIDLKNENAKNKDEILFFVNVIPDEFPRINVNQMRDTVLYDFIMIAGNAVDDYGISKILLKFKISDKSKQADKNQNFNTLKLNHVQGATAQEYFHQLDLKTLNIQPGQKIEYFVEVWDNDGINGSKSARSSTLEFALPDQNQIEKELDKTTNAAEKQIDKTLEEAKEVKKQLEELENKLKTKNKLNWQDKKAIEDLLKKHEELKEETDKMSKQNQLLNEQQKRFSEQDKRIADKAEKLQKLMDELLDDETKKLFEELEKLIQEQNIDMEKLNETLEKLNKKEDNVEKDLERMLELFKKMKFDAKLDQVTEKLDKLAEKQEDLAEENAEEKNKEKNDKAEKNDKSKEEKSSKNEKSEDKSQKEDKNKNDDNQSDENKSDEKKPDEKQDELNKEFEDIKKDIDELEKMNEEMKNKQDLEKTDEQEKEVDQEQQKSSEQLQQQNKKSASKSQKKAAEKMQEMSQQLSKMSQENEQEQAEEDYDALRQILDNLLTLSFDQERVMRDFRAVSQRDPKFLDLSREQLKLKDDAKVVEDSLRALADRVFQIQSFVTRELADMNDGMDKASDAIKKRRMDIAAVKQQSAMTSMNNLALMLNDVLQQMQQSMAQGMSGNQMCKKPGGKPSLSQMQQQLNKQIQDLKKSGKSGKGLSEELAKIAAQQEAVRRALQQQMKAGKQKGDKQGNQNDGGNQGDGGNLSKMIEQMEKSEEDLVNKKVTQELINRQQEILTRLLESEKAQRERGLDEEREAEQVKEKRTTVPPEFAEYLKAKQKQIELLQTVPLNLNPFYKKAVSDYFQKVK